MEVIIKDYKSYLFLLVVSFVIAFWEVAREIKLKEKAQKITQRLLGRIVFFKDKIKSYVSSSSSSDSTLTPML